MKGCHQRRHDSHAAIDKDRPCRHNLLISSSRETLRYNYEWNTTSCCARGIWPRRRLLRYYRPVLILSDLEGLTKKDSRGFSIYPSKPSRSDCAEAEPGKNPDIRFISNPCPKSNRQVMTRKIRIFIVSPIYFPSQSYQYPVN